MIIFKIHHFVYIKAGRSTAYIFFRFSYRKTQSLKQKKDTGLRPHTVRNCIFIFLNEFQNTFGTFRCFGLLDICFFICGSRSEYRFTSSKL